MVSDKERDLSFLTIIVIMSKSDMCAGFEYGKREGVTMEETENKSMLILFGVIVAALLVILIAILGLDVPIVPVCVIVLIEAALAVCLHDVPIWLHALVVAAQIVEGILCHNVILVAMCVVIYLLGILTLKVVRD